MWAAGTPPQPSSWRRRSPTRASSATTATGHQWSTLSRPPTRPALAPRSPAPWLMPAPCPPDGGNGTYDLIAYFDCLHDMATRSGRPASAFDTLSPDGTILLVEPMAGERTADNLNPVGRVFSAASVLVCTPNALAGGGTALGTLATEAALRKVFESVGFTRFRQGRRDAVQPGLRDQAVVGAGCRARARFTALLVLPSPAHRERGWG